MAAYKALRLVWIKRRARVLQRAYSADRATAVLEATQDWYRFNGKALPNRVIRRVQEEVSA
ncbi:hypothetical protein LZ683_09675 [Comamonas testosteroni]|uniref:hypothetical protein n=1 Tax=Comamonas testosteroni TaxID=285 RepID=UPI0023AB1B63|nr:hypothetical protein [Comamonas testosteroni]WEE79601.1 hypothetical protein LZ683_09675 [Comamonas testosteroni]